MVIEINAAIQSVRTLNDLLKAGYSVRNANEISTATSEALSNLSAAWTAALASQKEQLALTKRVGELEKEISELKDWNREKERYAFTEIALNVPAYVLKSGVESNKTTHRLCATCFEDRKKSFLQNGPYGTDIVAQCAKCGSTFFSSTGRAAVFEVLGSK